MSTRSCLSISRAFGVGSNIFWTRLHDTKSESLTANKGKLFFVLPHRAACTRWGARRCRGSGWILSRWRESHRRLARRRCFCRWWAPRSYLAPRCRRCRRQWPGRWRLKWIKIRCLYVYCLHLILKKNVIMDEQSQLSLTTDPEHGQFWRAAPRYPGPCRPWWGPEHEPHPASSPETPGRVPPERSWCLFLQVPETKNEVQIKLNWKIVKLLAQFWYFTILISWRYCSGVPQGLLCPLFLLSIIKP